MSLYDMYFSKKNKNHIYSILQELILKETGFDIDNNENYIDLYRVKYPLIFERTNVDNLTALNKSLIDEVGSLFISDIKSKYKVNKVEIVPEKTKSIPTKLFDTETLTTIPEEINSEVSEIYINSSERLGHSLNRYNYSIQLKDFIENIIIQEITIPEENNVLFSNPLLCLEITSNKKEYHFFCKLQSKMKLNDNMYNTYYPIKKLKIPAKNEIQIKIKTNNLLEFESEDDNIMIQKMKNINYENTNYLAIVIEEGHNLKVKDSVGIYCENKLVKTFIIKKIINGCLLVENKKIDYDKNKKYSLLNMNLQNNILLIC